MKYIFILFLLFPTLLSAGDRPSLATFIKHIEKHYKLPRHLIDAIIAVESAGKVGAVNHDDGTKLQKLQGKVVKSVGLMQLQLATARHMGFRGTFKQLLHPMVNIEYGARYLRMLLDTHKNNVAHALTCYNSGPSSGVCSRKVYTPYVGKVLNALISSR